MWWIWYEFGECEEWKLVGMNGGHGFIVPLHMGRK